MKETLKKKSFWLRLAMPLVIVCAWLLFSGIGGPYFGKISEVSSNDLATFLPTSAESTRVKDKLEAFQDSSALPLIVVFESDSKLTEEQQVKLGDYRAKLQTHKEVVKDISPTVLSEDGKAGFLLVPLNSGADLGEVIPEIRTGINK